MGNEFSDDYENPQPSDRRRPAQPHPSSSTSPRHSSGYHAYQQGGNRGPGAAVSNVIYAQGNPNQPWIILPGPPGVVTYLNTITGQIYSTPAAAPHSAAPNASQPLPQVNTQTNRTQKEGSVPPAAHAAAPAAVHSAGAPVAPPMQPQRVVYVVQRPQSVFDDMVDSFFAPVVPMTPSNTKYIYSGIQPQQHMRTAAPHQAARPHPQTASAPHSGAATAGADQSGGTHAAPSEQPQSQPQPHASSIPSLEKPKANSNSVAGADQRSAAVSEPIAAPPAVLPKGFQPYDEL
eukprot:TRINITY_DN3610_c0_g1_i1.p1 TRINITY_DN3610_c0_g1~~TRINITY_DN3610_c0_g1_i1.p1  ORF type:complete len:290 (-),score=39.20 TRINITY_DN3610_c0_g1_i1:365-1234(-)